MTIELLAACQAMPKAHLTYITSETGKPTLASAGSLAQDLMAIQSSLDS
jgi:hypothetical protein